MPLLSLQQAYVNGCRLRSRDCDWRERLFLVNSITQGRCSRNTIPKRVIYTLYFAFCNAFLRATCHRRCTMLCRAWCPSTALPPASSVQTSAAQQLLSGATPSTPKQSITESFWDTLWRRHPLLQKDDVQKDRTATQLSFSAIAKDTNCSLWTQPV